MKTQKLEILIAKKSDQLMRYYSLGTLNRNLGNAKSLAESAENLRRVTKNKNALALIDEIKRLQWELDCLEVERFIDNNPTVVALKWINLIKIDG